MTGRGYQPGQRIRIRGEERHGHHRVPRYSRGATGHVVAVHGPGPLPDDVVAQRPEPRVQPIYTVRVPAHTLFGAGDHVVHLDLWEDYLEAAPDQGGEGA
ncbi:MAG: nitrile hydratase subunit beta [Streptosporangiales bacterium]|nr:nitrile hydratase subunit beta [Streptosporangiales bacterium]